MIACGRCQTPNLDGSQFCDECGAPLIVTATTANPGSDPLNAETGGFRLPPVEPDESTMVRVDKIPVVPQPLPAPPPMPAAPLMMEAQPAPEPPASRRQVTSAVSGLVIPEIAPPPAPAPAPAGKTASAKLVIERGRAAGKQFAVNGEEAYIGRWDADGGVFPDVDLDADDPEAKVSRRHARIVRQSGQYYVEDLGSTNGTFINRGRRLLPGDRHALNDGDELIIGKMFMRFYVVRN
jgi:hypothetical protein